MRAQCVLVATTLLRSGAKFHSFLYTGSKKVRVSMGLCYGGMSNVVFAWFFTICTHTHRLCIKRDLVPPYIH